MTQVLTVLKFTTRLPLLALLSRILSFPVVIENIFFPLFYIEFSQHNVNMVFRKLIQFLIEICLCISTFLLIWHLHIQNVVTPATTQHYVALLVSNRLLS
jgi:hypothetical protein